MGYYDSFDCQVQCEEVFTGEGLNAQLTWEDYMAMEDAEQKLRESMDVMGAGLCVSLQAIQDKAYEMEDKILERIDFDWLWDIDTTDEMLAEMRC